MDVTRERLEAITKLFESGRLATRVSTVLPLTEVRAAHEMLAGARHEPGKIVLQVADVA